MVKKIIVVGGGIVGLAVAREAGQRWPGASITVLEKEQSVGSHQTGHNSGVLHSGLYYKPGSLNARLCTHGVTLMREYCASKSIPIDDTGKVVVAVREDEEQRLDTLHERGLANGVPGLRMISNAEFAELEPHAAGRRALYSPHTAIADYPAVCRALADDIAARGQLVLGAKVVGVRDAPGGTHTVLVEGGSSDVYSCDLLIACSGLQSDRVATRSGDDAEPRIVPFRGEYYTLRPEARPLVRGLIYPVPDPRYPFLGVHFTPTIHGDVLVGPNAILALAREKYRRWAFRSRDTWDTLRWPGFRKLARQHWRAGASEMYRAMFKRRYVALAQQYLPELRADDLVPARPGIRAQAVRRDGALVDDFWISRRGNVINVRNAPSPAATASLAIAEYICNEASKSE
jgi:L-2-hydroxyglutarate oxidase LhgO